MATTRQSEQREALHEAFSGVLDAILQFQKTVVNRTER